MRRKQNKERSPRAWVVQIESWISWMVTGRGAMATATLQKSSQDRDNQSEDQNRRKNDVSENAEIRVLGIGSNLDQEKQNDADKTRDDDRAAHQADVIAEQARWLGRWFGGAFVIRRPVDSQRFVAHLFGCSG